MASQSGDYCKTQEQIYELMGGGLMACIHYDLQYCMFL